MTKNTKAAADDNIAQEAKKKCFVMMPISDVDGYPAGHFNEVYQQLIRPAVEAAGYECHRADSTNSAHMIQLEIIKLAATADLCVCDLSTANPNVLFEYGIRQAFDKPTVLIRDNLTRRLFDIIGFRDIEYDASLRISGTLAVRDQIAAAIKDTIAGAEDGQQIFSLVKLMNLTTAAAIPTADLDPVQAQIQLLSKQIGALSERLRTIPPQSANALRQLKHLQYEPNIGATTVLKDGLYVDQLRDGSVVVRDDRSPKGYFADVEAFLGSAYAAEQPASLLESLKRYSASAFSIPVT